MKKIVIKNFKVQKDEFKKIIGLRSYHFVNDDEFRVKVCMGMVDDDTIIAYDIENDAKPRMYTMSFKDYVLSDEVHVLKPNYIKSYNDFYVAMYDYTTEAEMLDFCKYCKYYDNFVKSKIISRDELGIDLNEVSISRLFHDLVWYTKKSWKRTETLVYPNTISTIPENYIPEDIQDLKNALMQNSLVYRDIVSLKIYPYNLDINLKAVNMDYRMVYSKPEDKYYLVLIKFGSSLVYKDLDEDTIDIVTQFNNRSKI